MRLRRAMAVTAAVSALALSCQVLIGIRDDDFAVADASAVGEAGDAANEVGQSCSAPLPEHRPGEGEKKTYTFAVRSTVVAGSDPVGFDLDRACTCATAPGQETRPSCEPPDGAPPSGHCDLDGGLDNALLPLASGFSSQAIDAANAGINKDLRCGRKSLVLILQEYNGLADDNEVLLYAVPSFGINEPHAEEPDASECGPTFPAHWNGTDRWSVDSNLVDPGGVPRRLSFKGYVSNYRLVVDGREPGQPADSLAIVGFGSPPIGLSAPLLVAKLDVQDGGIFLEDGIMAGRTDVSKALASIGELIADDATGSRRCAEQAWPLVQAAVCATRDLVLDPRRDFTGAPCDSVSIVVRFTAAPGSVSAGTLPPPEVTDAAPCDPALLLCP